MAIPWREAQDSLRHLVTQPRFGLFSDFDGTLAPLAATAQQVQLAPSLRQTLAELQSVLPLVALISGRRAASLYAKVELPGLIYVGNHGLETLDEAGQVQANPAVTPYRPALLAALAELRRLEEPGAHTEDKGLTLTLHYRQAADPAAFQRRHSPAVQRIAHSHGLELFTGKMVYELRPPLDVHKGVALQDLVRQHQLSAALFLGDDVTDMDALLAVKDLRQSGRCAAWGVAVQSADAPAGLEAAADWLASGVDDVEALLTWLLAARKASST